MALAPSLISDELAPLRGADDQSFQNNGKGLDKLSKYTLFYETITRASIIVLPLNFTVPRRSGPKVSNERKSIS